MSASRRDRRAPTCGRRAVLAWMTVAVIGVAVLGGVQSSSAATAQDTYARLPLAFEANAGQAPSEFGFLARGVGYRLFLSRGEAVIVLERAVDPCRDATGTRRPSPRRSATAASAATERAALRMTLVGARPGGQDGQEQLAGVANYVIGSDPARWRMQIPTYARVRQSGVYPGIDLVYYGSQRRLEYDFVVAPGADPQRIRLALEDARPGHPAPALSIAASGDLVVATPAGDVTLVRPLAYQDVDGVRRPVDVRYVLERGSDQGDVQVALALGAYDAARSLVIDPVLSYSRYLGGSAADAGMALAVATDGSAFVAGFTSSTDLPLATPPAGTDREAFVTKLDPSGSVVYSTYLGGDGSDEALAIALDAGSRAYVTGTTTSSNFPSQNGFQTSLNGTTSPSTETDAWLAVLDASGVLVYGTYLGGSADDGGSGVAVDTLGKAYVTGHTQSGGFPLKSALQGSLRGVTDAFVAKLDPALSGAASLLWSTFLGGDGVDEGQGIAVDSSGNAHVVGFTDSATNFPTTNGYLTTPGGGIDAFLTKLATSGASILYSTYLGSTGDESAFAVAVGADGLTSVVGWTGSALRAHNGFQQTAGSDLDGFMASFNTALVGSPSLLYLTYIGGTGDDLANGVAVNAEGHVFVTGETSSPAASFPLKNAVQPSPGGGTDAFIVKIDPGSGDAASLLYSTFLGGDQDDSGQGVGVDGTGAAYVAGVTASTNFTLVPAANSTLAGGQDAFVAKLVEPDLAIITFDAPASADATSTITVNVTTKNLGAAEAGPTTVNFVMSPGSFRLGAPLGTWSVGTLAPGASDVSGPVQLSLNGVTFPSGVPNTPNVPINPGQTYTLYAKADGGNVLSEASEANNRVSRALQIRPNGVDLVVSSLSVPSTGGPGLPIAVTDTTANLGAVGATDSVTEFYVSPDNQLGNGNDQFLGSRTVAALAAGATSAPVQTTLTLPQGLTLGTWFIIARANGGATPQGETNATNNVLAKSFKIGPDLNVSYIQVNLNSSGGLLDIIDTTRNLSFAAAPSSKTGFFLSSDNVFSAPDVFLGERVIPALGPRNSTSPSDRSTSGTGGVPRPSFPVPADLPPGQYHVIAKADYLDLITETTETNNSLATTSKVTLGPDLTVPFLTVPRFGVPGTNVLVNNKVKNRGTTKAEDFDVAFYLRPQGGGAETFLGSRHITRLDAGKESQVPNTPMGIPSGTAAGVYELIVKADGAATLAAAGDVAELDETNNTKSVLIGIRPDYVITSLTGPSRAQRGTTIDVSEITKNLGAAGTVSTKTKIVLSTNRTVESSDRVLGFRIVPPLAVNDSDSASHSLLIPASVPAGPYYLIAVADADNAEVESIETNNLLTKQITIDP